MEIYGFMGLWVYEAQKKLFSNFFVFSSQRLHGCFFYRFLYSSSFPLAFRIPLRLFLYSPPRVIHARERMARTGLRARGRSGGLSFAALPS